MKKKKAKIKKAGKRAAPARAKSLRLELPDRLGRYGKFGGCFAPETLMPAIEELAAAWMRLRADRAFLAEYHKELNDYAGRPSPITHLKNLSAKLGGAQIWLKREDLNHTGSHKINNALGQILLARRMGKTRIIAETGAGQHGVAVATVCARFGLPCTVYMGEEDCRRQAVNVQRMKYLGAKVHPVTSGTRTLKDAINEAVRDWITHVDDTYYLLGSATGFHPYPLIVRDLQKVIGIEARAQFKKATGTLPSVVAACVNGGSNAIGIFYAFIDDPKVKLLGIEAAGLGVDSGQTAATFAKGKPGVFHGSLSYVLQSPEGQITETHSISAGLDYPGVGPEHAYLKDCGRAEYVSATDEEAVGAFLRLAKAEGILPALESSHALAEAMKRAAGMGKKESILVCLSGRGDKDMENVAQFQKAKLLGASYLLA